MNSCNFFKSSIEGIIKAVFISSPISIPTQKRQIVHHVIPESTIHIHYDINGISKSTSQYPIYFPLFTDKHTDDPCSLTSNQIKSSINLFLYRPFSRHFYFIFLQIEGLYSVSGITLHISFKNLII